MSAISRVKVNAMTPRDGAVGDFLMSENVFTVKERTIR